MRPLTSPQPSQAQCGLMCRFPGDKSVGGIEPASRHGASVAVARACPIGSAPCSPVEWMTTRCFAVVDTVVTRGDELASTSLALHGGALAQHRQSRRSGPSLEDDRDLRLGKAHCLRYRARVACRWARSGGRRSFHRPAQTGRCGSSRPYTSARSMTSAVVRPRGSTAT